MNQPSKPYSLSVVLVRSLYENNVGASSRAMSNMGAHRLILLNPQCELTYSAQQAAATGQEGLQNRTVYQSWSEFFASEPDGIRISLTARDGRGRAVQDLKATLEWIAQEEPRFQDPETSSVQVYLIFGPEDWGLSAEDLELTHFCSVIPTYGENSSLNLAQAVLLALFIVRETWGGQRTILDGSERTRQGPGQIVFPEETLKTWLMEMGYDLSKPKINVYTTLKRMLLHNAPTQKELVALETTLQQAVRKLRELKTLKGEN